MQKVSEILVQIPAASASAPEVCPMCGKTEQLGSPCRMCAACYDGYATRFPVEVSSGNHAGLRARLSTAESRPWEEGKFRRAERARLPGKPEVIEAAITWAGAWTTGTKPDKCVANIHGITDRGKTFLMTLMVREIMCGKSGLPVIRWPGDIGPLVSDAWMKGDMSALLARDKDAPVLVFDDIDKNKITERVAEYLFAVFDARIRNELPCIITTNVTGRELDAAMPGEYGAALLRRMRQSGIGLAP